MRSGWLAGFDSTGAPARGALLLLLGSSTAHVSWSRFDDVTKDSPIVLLDKPGSMKQGFGVSVATATHDQEVEVLVGGGVGVSEHRAVCHR